MLFTIISTTEPKSLFTISNSTFFFYFLFFFHKILLLTNQPNHHCEPENYRGNSYSQEYFLGFFSHISTYFFSFNSPCKMYSSKKSIQSPARQLAQRWDGQCIFFFISRSFISHPPQFSRISLTTDLRSFICLDFISLSD